MWANICTSGNGSTGRRSKVSEFVTQLKSRYDVAYKRSIFWTGGRGVKWRGVGKGAAQAERCAGKRR